MGIEVNNVRWTGNYRVATPRINILTLDPGISMGDQRRCFRASIWNPSRIATEKLDPLKKRHLLELQRYAFRFSNITSEGTSKVQKVRGGVF